MSKRKGRWDPPLPGPSANLGPQVTVLISDDEKAGKPLPPLVEFIQYGPPPDIAEPQPRPSEPPPLPFDRVAAVAGLQRVFALLTDDELRVARVWLLGLSISAACRLLEMNETTARNHWENMRRKLRDALRADAGL